MTSRKNSSSRCGLGRGVSVRSVELPQLTTLTTVTPLEKFVVSSADNTTWLWEHLEILQKCSAVPCPISPGRKIWVCSSIGRAPCLHHGGRRFDSCHIHNVRRISSDPCSCPL